MSKLIRIQRAAGRLHERGEKIENGVGGVAAIIAGIVTAIGGVVTLMKVICPEDSSEQPTE